MWEPAVWVALIAGITAIVVTMLACLAVLRGRKQARADLAALNETLTKIEETADAALDEISKTSQQIVDDIEEKYQAVLFIYNLIDEKKKEILALRASAQAGQATQSRGQAGQTRGQDTQPRGQAAHASKRKNLTTPARGTTRQPAGGDKTRHHKIHELHQSGLPIAEIAKKLNIGQGEVKLILDLSKR